ncbi:glycoside hydrolase family 43 protein [Mucilaginibacter sp. PAMB04168]|uniref:glycoside hydrolase family 43 protein n=1 Tax=Mucilaginibacter sp. PAMB04168 TaxID=3138567 RepID=UPI0031F656C5
MRYLFTLLLLTLIVSQTQAQHNPVLKGWYADPEGVKYGHTYWIFPTYSAKYKDQVFMDAFSSADLKTWTKHPHIIDTAAVKWANKAMWAPAVLKKGSKYYLFFGANDVHPGEVGGIGVAVAGKPDGPYKDLLGRPLIDTIVNGAQPIDQFVFRDKDGSYYMYYGGWGHCNIVKLKKDFTGIEPLPDGTLYKEITPDHYAEGPYMFLRNNKYYFMWSEGGWTGPDYKVAYAIADSPFGPFKRVATVLEQDPKIATGAGHHSVIHSAKDDKYYIVYHRRPLDQSGANRRVVCLDEMLFDKQGHILPVKMTLSRK